MQMVSLALLVAAASASASNATRHVSWWFDVGENATVDALNVAAIAKHRSVFTRVMPCSSDDLLDGNVTRWWGAEAQVNAWLGPLKETGVPVLPYLIDIDNSTQMHLVYANSTAFIADAVAVAQHFGLSGWFIDYEDEYPADTDPDKSAKLASFLTELGDSLHAKDMELTICVASWSSLLSDYESIARSSVDELQQMSTYANPSNYVDILDTYFAAIKAGDGGRTTKAGVGVGVYYDGHGGYENDWSEESARSFVNYVAAAGGNIDVFRLLNDEEHGWPRDEFWWDILSDFVSSE